MSDSEEATDPRLDVTPPAPEPTPEPVAELEAAIEADPDPAPEPEPVVAAEPDPDADPAPKPKKTVEDALKSRVGHLVKQGGAKDAEIARLLGEKQALEALLNGKATPAAEGDPPAPAARPAPEGERLYTRAELVEIAKADKFAEQSNAVYATGVEKHGATFKEAVENLNAVGIMTTPFLEAAFATDAAPEVLNFLGSDPDEAARIADLPPIRMAAEMTKIAARLTAPAPKPRASAAPAPISPVGGVVSPEIDLRRIADDGDDISGTWVAARAKQGATWAQPMNRRRN